MQVEDQLNLPSWLTPEFLGSTLDGDFTLKDVRVRRAVAKGENFLSVLYRVQIDQHCSLIIKTLPEGEAMRKFLCEMKGFEKELHMYQVTLPAINRLFAGSARDISARALRSPRTDVIVLEDLRTLGYRMAERNAGMDLNHAILTVRALAYLHAGSVGLIRDDPSCLDMYEESFYVDEGDRKDMMKAYLNMHIQTLATQIEKWSGYEHFAPRIRKLTDSAVDCMMGMVRPKEGSFSVLNHGDCWVNNVLFSYDENSGKVRDARFVDFQITRYACPALDLQYFLNTSLSDEIRFEEEDRLLKEYHEELMDRFAQLGISANTYSFQNLQEDYKETALFGFVTACTLLCIVLADRSAAPDFNDLPEDNKPPETNPMEKAYEGERFRQVFQTFLLHYEHSGIF